MHLRVDNDTPARLLAAADAPHPTPEDRGATRVPRLRARRVTWTRNSSMELNSPLYALVYADRLALFRLSESSVENIVWPTGLRQLFFGSRFDQPIQSVVLPAPLEVLNLGGFNGSIEGVAWPAALQHLTFGWRFNQPIVGVVWPASLQRLNFGERFNQPVESLILPARLRTLTLGWEFNQPIESLVFPAGLQELTLGGEFNQPIESVVFPPGLLRLDLGRKFNQPVTLVNWPASLHCLTFGHFDPDTDHYSSSFDQAIDRAAWPASLREVEFGKCFRQSVRGLGTWMPNLEELVLLAEDYHGLFVDMDWPTSLKVLRVDDEGWGSLDAGAVPPTVEVVS